MSEGTVICFLLFKVQKQNFILFFKEKINALVAVKSFRNCVAHLRKFEFKRKKNISKSSSFRAYLGHIPRNLIIISLNFFL